MLSSFRIKCIFSDTFFSIRFLADIRADGKLPALIWNILNKSHAVLRSYFLPRSKRNWQVLQITLLPEPYQKLFSHQKAVICPCQNFSVVGKVLPFPEDIHPNRYRMGTCDRGMGNSCKFPKIPASFKICFILFSGIDPLTHRACHPL